MNDLYLKLKGLEEIEKLGRNEYTLHCRPRSLEMRDYIRP